MGRKLKRMWTTTNLETGQKEQRLHRKNTMELGGGVETVQQVSEPVDVVMAEAAVDNTIDNPVNPSTEACSPQQAEMKDSANESQDMSTVDTTDTSGMEEGDSKMDNTEETQNTEMEKKQKVSPGRMWTNTNLATGGTEKRLHRKNTVEMSKSADHDTDVTMTDSKMQNQVTTEHVSHQVTTSVVEEPTQKPSPQRAWTKTNLATGETEKRLHRKDTVELNAGTQGTVDEERTDPEATEDDEDGVGEMELTNSQEF